MGIGLIITLVVVGVILLWAVATYNGLVSRRARVDESWSGIDVQLKRRHDLVPNLVETVRGYAEHERSTLEAATRARAGAVAASGPREARPAEARLTTALGGVLALAEAYPGLRASEGFLRLQAQLAEIEDEIQAARRIYNANVQHFNTAIQVFPNLIVARLCSFAPREFFEIQLVAERLAPHVAV